ncbi:hypothetical protein AB6A40_001362 [Gnathostoma spinigerum]|uniref:Uncharacterized protein n=1 Tax=Gnathostoma spinigerum TaxID=75299 RepID=A0ABD6ECU9_9BILA
MLCIPLTFLLSAVPLVLGQSVMDNVPKSAVWPASRGSPVHDTVLTSSDMSGILPGSQRMPLEFRGFLSGGRTSSGFDLETFTKNAVAEANRRAYNNRFVSSGFGGRTSVLGSRHYGHFSPPARPPVRQSQSDKIYPLDSYLRLNLPLTTSPSFNALPQLPLHPYVPENMAATRERNVQSNSLLDNTRNGFGGGSRSHKNIPWSEQSSFARVRPLLTTSEWPFKAFENNEDREASAENTRRNREFIAGHMRFSRPYSLNTEKPVSHTRLSLWEDDDAKENESSTLLFPKSRSWIYSKSAAWRPWNDLNKIDEPLYSPKWKAREPPQSKFKIDDRSGDF